MYIHVYIYIYMLLSARKMLKICISTLKCKIGELAKHRTVQAEGPLSAHKLLQVCWFNVERKNQRACKIYVVCLVVQRGHRSPQYSFQALSAFVPSRLSVSY